MQVVDGNEQGFRGVLRYLGEIQGKGNVTFAGIELLDEWQGLGKNDGIVAGVQYFATNAKCGMFLAPSRLCKLSTCAPTDAVARPQSALSGRTSRASEHDPFERAPSVTPAKPRGSVTPSSMVRPGSSAGTHRSLSRASARPGSAMSASRPPSRSALAPRKSTVDEEVMAQKRARANAEQVAAAHGRINPGSKAAQLMNMTAKELARRKQQGTEESPPLPTVSRSRPSMANGGSVGVGSDSTSPSRLSPLKDVLTNKLGSSEGRTHRPSLGGTATPGMLARPRKSIMDLRAGAGHTPFKPSTDARRSSSVVGDTNQADSSPSGVTESMPPPFSASTASASRHQRSASIAEPTTPSRPASQHSRTSSALSHHQAPSRSASALGHSEPDAASETAQSRDVDDDELKVSIRAQKARSLALLEQMDLDATPKKQDLSAHHPRSVSRASNASQREEGNVAEAVVPLLVYEEVYNELTAKTLRLETLQQSFDELKAQKGTRESETTREKKRLWDEQEQFKRMIEEEREVEREDEKRRRKEIEAREKDARAEVESLRKDLRRSQDENGKKESERIKEVQEIQQRLTESTTLGEELKKALATREVEKTSVGDAFRAEFDGQLKAKEAEIEQLQGRINRLEAQWQGEREELNKEIDELKEAGQETITLYELRLEEAAEHQQLAVEEVEDKMRQLQSKAQAAIAEAERQKDAALQDGGARTSGGVRSAAEIEKESLTEQLSHAQDKLLSTEDQLAEANSSLEAEREAGKRRKEKALEADTRWKAEVKKLKDEIEKLVAEVREARDKSDELAEALEERGAALESERAELETLRAEALGHGGPDNMTESSGSAATTSKLKAEVEQLSALLEGARSGKREASRKAEELERKLVALEASASTSAVDDSVVVGNGLKSPRGSMDVGGAGSSDAKRFSSASTSSRRSRNSGSLRDSLDPAVAQSREMTGLRSIVNALSEENADLRAKMKDTASADVKEPSEANSDASPRSGGDASSDLASLRKELAKLRSQLSTSKAQCSSLERKNEELAREVSDLEALVEAGMWAKEELEAKLQDCERKIAKLQQATASDSPATERKVLPEAASPRGQKGPQSSDAKAKTASSPATLATSGDTGTKEPKGVSMPTGEVCDDCGSREHTLENCPLLDEIF